MSMEPEDDLLEGERENKCHCDICKKIDVLRWAKSQCPDDYTRNLIEEIGEEWLNAGDDADWAKFKRQESEKELSVTRRGLSLSCEECYTHAIGSNEERMAYYLDQARKEIENAV